jgi:hypothetical protein
LEGWCDVSVVSLNPGDPVRAGEHVVIKPACLRLGEVCRSLYESESVTLLGSTAICVPEAATLALRGLGGLLLCRRSKAA